MGKPIAIGMAEGSRRHSLATTTRDMSIHEACERTFRPIPGGYKSEAALFIWCHRNESKLMNYVNELRLS